MIINYAGGLLKFQNIPFNLPAIPGGSITQLCISSEGQGLFSSSSLFLREI